MKKEFNITGTCIPSLHYMMDNRAKLAGVMAMIESGKYFTINRPPAVWQDEHARSPVPTVGSTSRLPPCSARFSGDRRKMA